MKLAIFVSGAALAAALISNAARAQDQSSSTPAPAPDGSVLGRTYISVDVDSQHYRDIAKGPDGLGSGFDANVPISDHFDYNFSYGFQYAESHEFHLTDNDVATGVTTFYKFGHISPFASAGLSYDWDRVDSERTSVELPGRFDRTDLDLKTGLEFPLTQAASLRADVGDDDSTFRKPHPRTLDYGLDANYWLGSSVGTFVGATIKDGHSGALNATEYTAGIRFSFD